MKRILYHNQVEITLRIQERIQHLKIKVTHHISRTMEKGHMIISINAKKVSKKINTH